MIPALQGLDLLCLIQENPARTGTAWSAFLTGAEIIDAAQRLLAARYHLEDISALDAQEGFLIVYSFEHMERPGRISLRILAPHEAPAVPSIAHVYQGAEWHEREAADFYGITFEGHPNPIRLLLPGDMHEYPLRKQPAARAPLRILLGGLNGEVAHKKPEFTLLDAEAPTPAADDAKQGAAAAPQSEAPSAGAPKEA